MADEQGAEEGSTLNLIGNTTITSTGGRIRIRNGSLTINILGPLTVLNPQGLASVLASASGGVPVGVPSGSWGSLHVPSGSLRALGVDLDLDGGVVSSHGAEAEASSAALTLPSGSGGFQALALEGEFHPGWPDPRVRSDVQAPVQAQPPPIQVQAEPPPVQVQPPPVQVQPPLDLDPITAGIRDAAHNRKLSESEVLYLLKRNSLPITNPKAMKPTSGVFTYPAEQYNRFRDGHEYFDGNRYYQPQSPELKYHISFAKADNMPRMTLTRRRYRLADGSSPVFVCHYLLEDDGAADLAVLVPLVPL